MLPIAPVSVPDPQSGMLVGEEVDRSPAPWAMQTLDAPPPSDPVPRTPVRISPPTPELTMDSRTLWANHATGDIAARNALLTENLSLVHHVARQLSRSLAAEADFDELVSAGTLGLMSALEAFDVSRGLAFSTFAVPRIRGSILDELRRQDHVPRSIRRKMREIGHA